MYLITPPRRTKLSRSPRYLPRVSPGEMKPKTCSSLHRWVSAWGSKAGKQWTSSASTAGMAALCWWGIPAECRITSTDHHHTTSIMESDRSKQWNTQSSPEEHHPAHYSALLSSSCTSRNAPLGMGRGKIFPSVQARYVLGFHCFIAQ